MDKDVLHAVHDDDLRKLLENLGHLKDFEEGKIKCKFCKDTVTFENLSTIFPESGSIKFVCNKPDCAAQLSSHLGPKI
jgi:hypothetical protein